VKARNREVNIFNMSLLDILCGALGAFCFLMLVLFPYWRPAGASAKDVEQQYQEAMQQLEDLKKKLAAMPDGAAMVEQLQQLIQKYKQQQAQLNKALNDAEEARKRLEEAEKEATLRNPLVVAMNWQSPGHGVDMYLRTRSQTKDGKEPPVVDPTKKQYNFFSGDNVIDCNRGPCSDVWSSNYMYSGKEVEVHYKFLEANGSPGAARIGPTFAQYLGSFLTLPGATVPQEQTSVFVGLLKLSGGKLEFAPQPEFAEEYKRLNKKDTPPPSPGR
jgi:hypothetical protein